MWQILLHCLLHHCRVFNKILILFLFQLLWGEGVAEEEDVGGAEVEGEDVASFAFLVFCSLSFIINTLVCG